MSTELLAQLKSRKPSLLPLLKEKLPTQSLAHHRCLIGIVGWIRMLTFELKSTSPACLIFWNYISSLFSFAPYNTGQIIIIPSSFWQGWSDSFWGLLIRALRFYTFFHRILETWTLSVSLFAEWHGIGTPALGWQKEMTLMGGTDSGPSSVKHQTRVASQLPGRGTNIHSESRNDRTVFPAALGAWTVSSLRCSAGIGWPSDHQLLWGGFPPDIPKSSLTFWWRASNQEARKLWIQPWFCKHCGTLRQIICFSGLFCLCSNAAAEPSALWVGNAEWDSSSEYSVVVPQKWKIHLPHDQSCHVGCIPQRIENRVQRHICTPVFP